MLSIKVTYLCCKFGLEYAFEQREKIITKWRSVQNMNSFVASIVTILWEENVQTITFVVWRYVCIYKWLIKMIVRIQMPNGNSAPNSGNNHNLTIAFEGGMQRFKRQSAFVFQNETYESEPPLNPSPLIFYKQFGTNSIIVLMFVDSQRVHI